MKEPIALALVFASALGAGGVVWLLARGAKPPTDGWFQWGLLAMGAASLLGKSSGTDAA